MSVNNIAFMGAQEFLETFLFMWSYDESKELLKEYLPIDANTNPYVKEAEESAAQLIVTMGIFKMIQYEEALLERLFQFVTKVIAALLLITKKGFNKLKSSITKGRIFQFAVGLIKQYGDEAIAKAQILLMWLQSYISARKNSYQSGSLIQASQNNRQNVVERDRSAMMMGKGLSENIINSLMFKLVTKKFTPKDKQLLKKILGKDDVENLDVDDVNKVADALFITDASGNVLGIPQYIQELLNGLGYFHQNSNPVI